MYNLSTISSQLFIKFDPRYIIIIIITNHHHHYHHHYYHHTYATVYYYSCSMIGVYSVRLGYMYFSFEA